MQISIVILSLTFVNFFNLKCVKGSGESSSRTEVQLPECPDFNDIEQAPTPRSRDAPYINVLEQDRVTVDVSDGSVLDGKLFFCGMNQVPNWLTRTQNKYNTIIIRMPSGVSMTAMLREKVLATHHHPIVAPTSVTVHLRNSSYYNAILEFFDEHERAAMRTRMLKSDETRTFVAMTDGLVYTGFFR